MLFKKRNHLSVGYIANNLSVVVGIVMIWRGTWYVLDEADKYFFGGSHTFTSILGIILGLIVLYAPDGNLEELHKL